MWNWRRSPEPSRLAPKRLCRCIFGSLFGLGKACSWSTRWHYANSKIWWARWQLKIDTSQILELKEYEKAIWNCQDKLEHLVVSMWTEEKSDWGSYLDQNEFVEQYFAPHVCRCDQCHRYQWSNHHALGPGFQSKKYWVRGPAGILLCCHFDWKFRIMAFAKD